MRGLASDVSMAETVGLEYVGKKDWHMKTRWNFCHSNN